MAAALLLCALLASGTGTCAATARAAATKRVSMAYNGAASQEKNAVHLFAAIFKEYVEARTNGRVQIVLYPDSQLGNEDERMELVNDGLLQINVASYAGMAPIIPELFAASIPFLFDSYKAAHDANVITRVDVEARDEERVKFIADRGVKVYRPTDAEINEFRQIGQPSYITWLKGQIGCEWIDAALKDAAWANKEVKK